MKANKLKILITIVLPLLPTVLFPCNGNSDGKDAALRRLENRQMRQFGPAYLYRNFIKEQKSMEDLMLKKSDTENFSSRLKKNELDRNREDDAVGLKGNKLIVAENNEEPPVVKELNPGDICQMTLGDETYFVTKDSVMDEKFNPVSMEVFKEMCSDNFIRSADLNGDMRFTKEEIMEEEKIVETISLWDFNGSGSLDIGDKGVLKFKAAVTGDPEYLALLERYCAFESSVDRADINGDSLVDYKDVALLAEMYSFWSRRSALEGNAFIESFFGDTNGDGEVNGDDLRDFGGNRGRYITDRTFLDRFPKNEAIISNATYGHEPGNRFPKEGYILGKLTNKPERADRGTDDTLSASALSPETQVAFLQITDMLVYLEGLAGVSLKDNYQEPGKKDDAGGKSSGRKASAGVKWSMSGKEGIQGEEDIIQNIDLLEKAVRDEVMEVAEYIKVIARDMSIVRALDLKVISSSFEWMQKMQDTLLKDYEKETAKYYQDIASTLKMSVSGHDFILKMRTLDARVRDIRAKAPKELSAEEKDALAIYDKYIAAKRDAYIKELNGTVRHFVASVKAVINKAKKAAYREVGGKSESFVTVDEKMLEK